MCQKKGVIEMAHMSIEDREKIEELLKEKLNFTAIGKEIGYHRTTIANEIIKHKTKGKQNTYGTNFVYCEYENTCEKYYGIGCKKKCDKFKPKNCDILSNPPYVCNGCKNKNKCRLQKFFYRANEAQKEYNPRRRYQPMMRPQSWLRIRSYSSGVMVRMVPCLNP